jgi:hypothetical protein
LCGVSNVFLKNCNNRIVPQNDITFLYYFFFGILAFRFEARGSGHESKKEVPAQVLNTVMEG